MKTEYAIVDIETTGGTARHEKIIEIGIALFDGEKVIGEFETLINPERSIPPFITRLTGIDNEMVRNAPKFYEVARDIVEFTEGRVFVAHNVRFDYGFIQEEFNRLGFHFSRKQLCTVRMTRKAFPGLPSYSLGKLIPYFGIRVDARHRAMADVLATVEVFKRVLERDPAQAGLPNIKNQLKNVSLPESIPLESILELPEKTGVYYFYDADDRIIYIGKSINIQKRIRQHFQQINPKSNKLYQRATRISFEITGSELVACLLESEEIKKHRPEINRASRTREFPYFTHYYLNLEGYLVFETARNTIKNRQNKQILGEHANLPAARSTLQFLQREYQLCGKLTGQEEGPGACFAHILHQCQGACLGKEPPDSYNGRASLAIRHEDLIRPENFLLIDEGKDTADQAVILVRHGKYYGHHFLDRELPVHQAEALAEHIPPRPWYPEQNTIIKRFLNNPGKIRMALL